MNTAPNASTKSLIAVSISFERENLLARGLGLDHLKELLVRLSRPLLRQGIDIAYGGHWGEQEGNFTYELLHLVDAEKTIEAEHRIVATKPEGSRQSPVGRLINHSAWPGYRLISPTKEAQWINCCRIVRITPELAGLDRSEWISESQLPAARDDKDYPREALMHEAVCLSAMRRLVRDGLSLPIPDLPEPEKVAPIAARIVLGGKVRQYSGFMPGIFEEALLSLETGSPLYLLGGFGGAAEVLAEALLADEAQPLPEEFGDDWQRRNTPALATLQEACVAHRPPTGSRETSVALEALRTQLTKARSGLSAALNTGLDDADNRLLLSTRDMREAVNLVHRGLRQQGLMR